MVNKPIFFDASGRRAARIKIVAWAAGLALLVISVGFAASLMLAPPVRGLVFPQRAAQAPVLKRAQKAGLLARAERRGSGAAPWRNSPGWAWPRAPCGAGLCRQS